VTFSAGSSAGAAGSSVGAAGSSAGAAGSSTGASVAGDAQAESAKAAISKRLKNMEILRDIFLLLIDFYHFHTTCAKKNSSHRNGLSLNK